LPVISPREVHETYSYRGKLAKSTFGQDVAGRVIGQAEEETVLPAHLLQITDEGSR
jgi:hypothetical protein